MFYRSFMLLALLMLFGLSGCQQRFEPEPVSALDDEVILAVMDDMKQSIRNGNMKRWQGLFAKNAVIEIIDLQGVKYVSGPEDISEIMASYMNFGRGFDLHVKDQLIMVSADRQSAEVIRQSVEMWLFRDKYRDVSAEVDHYIEWQLMNGRPQIIRMTREYRKRSLLDQVGDKQIAPMWTGDRGVVSTSDQ